MLKASKVYDKIKARNMVIEEKITYTVIERTKFRTVKQVKIHTQSPHKESRYYREPHS